jgi:hypothetical protein
MVDYTRKPAQFRLPAWAKDFLAQEAAEQGVTKTQVIVDALECLKRARFEALLEEGYRGTAEFDLQEVRAWDATLADGLEDEEW